MMGCERSGRRPEGQAARPSSPEGGQVRLRLAHALLPRQLALGQLLAAGRKGRCAAAGEGLKREGQEGQERSGRAQREPTGQTAPGSAPSCLALPAAGGSPLGFDGLDKHAVQVLGPLHQGLHQRLLRERRGGEGPECLAGAGAAGRLERWVGDAGRGGPPACATARRLGALWTAAEIREASGRARHAPDRASPGRPRAAPPRAAGSTWSTPARRGSWLRRSSWLWLWACGFGCREVRRACPLD